ADDQGAKPARPEPDAAITPFGKAEKELCLLPSCQGDDQHVALGGATPEIAPIRIRRPSAIVDADAAHARLRPMSHHRPRRAKWCATNAVFVNTDRARMAKGDGRDHGAASTEWMTGLASPSCPVEEGAHGMRRSDCA